MNLEEILAKLVAFPTVVGTPNGEMVDWIREYCQAAGAEVSVHPGPEGDRSNLFATMGPRTGRGYILSGHMDVVPAGGPGWSSDPFVMRRDGGRLYGRGTADMKGFIACALATLPKFAAMRLEVIGRSGHSSRPDLGLNAIHAMAGIVMQAAAYAQSLTNGPLDLDFARPYSSLQVGVIGGGQAVNIIPDRCTADIELRAIPGLSPSALLEPPKGQLVALRESGFEVGWHELSVYPRLSLAEECELTALMVGLTGREPRKAVSYGAEAGLYQQAGIDAIICGPGDIANARRPNEYVEYRELAACQRMMEDLGARLATSANATSI